MARKARSKGGKPIAASPLVLRHLEPGDWSEVIRLFGDRGACGGCWCMWWRMPRGGKAWEEAKGSKNRDRLRRLVNAGRVHAILAFSGDEPVGWCSFGPRDSFPRLERVRALQRKYTEDTWSIVCFYLPAPWRRKGVATRLLEAATRRAFALGAREVEGYPVSYGKEGEATPAAFAFTGVPAIFRQCGYRRLPRPGMSRPIYRIRKA